MNLVWKASSCCGQGSKQILGAQVPCGSDRPLFIKSITWHRQPWLVWIVPTHPLLHYTSVRKCQSENISTFGIKCDIVIRTVPLPYVKAKAFSSKEICATKWLSIFVLLYSSEFLRNNPWKKECYTFVGCFHTFTFLLDFKDQLLNSGKWRKLKIVRYFRPVVLRNLRIKIGSKNFINFSLQLNVFLTVHHKLTIH